MQSMHISGLYTPFPFFFLCQVSSCYSYWFPSTGYTIYDEVRSLVSFFANIFLWFCPFMIIIIIILHISKNASVLGKNFVFSFSIWNHVNSHFPVSVVLRSQWVFQFQQFLWALQTSAIHSQSILLSSTFSEPHTILGYSKYLVNTCLLALTLFLFSGNN